MPVPGSECGPGRPLQEEFFLAALDAKFAQQEQLIRGLLEAFAPAPAVQSAVQSVQPRQVAFLFVGDSKFSQPETSVFHQQSDDPSVEPPRTVKPTKKTLATLGAQVMSEKWIKDPPLKAFVKEKLDLPIGCVVLANVVLMIIHSQWVGISTDVSLGLIESSDTFFSQEFFDITEYIFFGIYLVDLVVRIAVLRREWYYDPKRGLMYMNVFDAFLVLLNFSELLVLPFLDSGATPELNTNQIRLIKLTRVFRTLRVVKTLSMLRQLRHLVATCIASIGALFWSLVLLLFLKLIFALMLSQTMQLYIQSPQENYEEMGPVLIPAVIDVWGHM